MKKIIFVFISLFFFQIADAQNWNTEVVNGVTMNGEFAVPMAVAKDTSGNLWVATDSGLFKRVGGVWSYESSAPVDEYSGWTDDRKDVAVDNQNRVWWVTGFRLFFCDGISWQQIANYQDSEFSSVETDENGNAYALSWDTLMGGIYLTDLQTNSYLPLSFTYDDHILKIKNDTLFVSEDGNESYDIFNLLNGNWIASYPYLGDALFQDYCIGADNNLYAYDDAEDINSNPGSFINVTSLSGPLFSIPVVFSCAMVEYAMRVNYYNGNLYFLTYHDTSMQSLVVWYYNIQNQTSGEIPVTVTMPYQLNCPGLDMIDGEMIISGYNGIGQMFFVTNNLNTSCSANFSMHPDSTLAHTWLALNTATGISPISYSWSWGDGGTSTGVTPSHTYAAPDYYPICLTITDAAGCVSTYCDSSTYLSKLEDDMSMVTVNVVTQLPNGVPTVTAKDNSISISPNPCITCEITRATNATDLTVTDILGRKINTSFRKSANGFHINLPENSNGIFFIRNIKTGEVVKFVKE